MNEIQLLTVENVPAAKDRSNLQTIRFLLSVENLGYVKEVDVVWTTGQGEWLALPAQYLGPLGENREYWQAQTTVAGVSGAAGPGVIRFALRLRCGGKEYWDNNGGEDYQTHRSPFTVLILNLHCYQEEDQDRKLTQIARAISDLQVSVVCFQEVAEDWNHGDGDRASNAARIINGRLQRPLHICTDWSHRGFDRHREGVAILSRYPILQHHGRYVSDGDDAHNIHSRKVLMAQLRVPYMGIVNVFSVHLSWWEDGFQAQFQRLANWAHAEAAEAGGATLLCGDFNVTPGSPGYRCVMEGGRYEDQYLAVHASGNAHETFRINDPHWRDFPGTDCRVDFIFMRKGDALRVTSARTLFTEQDYGRVSDHCGYLMTFEPK